MKNPFIVDWSNRNEVIAYCKQLNNGARPGSESSVIKVKGRSNYNITHTSQIKDRHADAELIYPK